MINLVFELQDIVKSRWNLNGSSFTKNRANYLTSRYKKKTEKFCEKNKGFFKCRECKGIGFLKYSFKNFERNRIIFYGCKSCGLSGVETWIDKMVRGWKKQ